MHFVRSPRPHCVLLAGAVTLFRLQTLDGDTGFELDLLLAQIDLCLH